MKIIKKTIIGVSLISILPLVLLSKNRTTPIANETHKAVIDVYDTTLNTNALVKDIHKAIKKAPKSKTIINGKKVTYIKNAKNVYTTVINKNKTINKNTIKKTVKKIINNKIYKTVKNTNISNKYFVDTTRCSSSCGVAIKKWNDAKKYCSIRGSQLPSKTQIERSNKYQKKECSDCKYWTNTEAFRRNGQSYPNRKVYVYDQAEGDFSKFSTKSTYVATCR